MKNRPSWEEIKTFPVAVFQTIRGPVVGKIGTRDQRHIKVWAPAFIQITSPTKIVFLPIGACESYIDFVPDNLIGTNPMPQALVEGYENYFEQFAKGEYNIKFIDAKIETETTEIDSVESVETV